MKVKHLLFPLLILLFISAKAELIDGPANFHIKPRSKIVISLNDDTEVNCFLLKNGWFKVSFDIKITKQQYEIAMRQYPKGHTIRSGEKLYNLRNKFIGVAIADIPDSLPDSIGGIRSTASYQMEIVGYVVKSNIKANSIPDNALDSVVIANTQHLEYDNLKSFMLKQGYKNQHIINKFLPEFNEYCIYESEDNSPGYRIGLIFENNNLIAIEHSRPIKIVNISSFKAYQLAQGNQILIIKTPKNLSPSALIKKIDEIFRGAG